MPDALAAGALPALLALARRGAAPGGAEAAASAEIALFSLGNAAAHAACAAELHRLGAPKALAALEAGGAAGPAARKYAARARAKLAAHGGGGAAAPPQQTPLRRQPS